MDRWTSRLPGAFEFEDALLFVWFVIVTPLLQFVLGGALRGLNFGNLDRGVDISGHLSRVRRTNVRPAR